MSPAIAPYLMELNEDEVAQLATSIESSLWEKIDIDTSIPDGEAYTAFVYNNGNSFSLTFYGDYTVDYKQKDVVNKYMVKGEAYETTITLLHIENIYDYLVPCEVENISPEGVWK